MLPHRSKNFITSDFESNKATAGVWNAAAGKNDEYILCYLFPDGKHGFKFMSTNKRVQDDEGLSKTAIAEMISEMNAYIQNYTYSWEVWIRAITKTE